MLYRRFPELPDMRVLDLGGVPQFWASVPLRPRHVTLVNLKPHHSELDWISNRQADACRLPEDLLADGFDLVVSNSVIEHVGGHARRRRFARMVRRAAPHHWVQTPYRYFPIEPHWVFPGQQFLPTVAKALISRHWPAAHIRARSWDRAVASALSVELLTVTEMRHYFADSYILRERYLGLTKSIIATR